MYHLSIHIGSIQVHLTPMAVNKVTDLPANKQWEDQFPTVQKRSIEISQSLILVHMHQNCQATIPDFFIKDSICGRIGDH